MEAMSGSENKRKRSTEDGNEKNVVSVLMKKRKAKNPFSIMMKAAREEAADRAVYSCQPYHG